MISNIHQLIDLDLGKVHSYDSAICKQRFIWDTGNSQFLQFHTSSCVHMRFGYRQFLMQCYGVRINVRSGCPKAFA